MRAAVLQELGATPAPADFREPEAGDGRTVVEVLAGGLNPIDLRVASGALADRRPPVPSVVGAEGVGRTPDGRRVYFSRCVPPFGSIAERTLVESGALVDVPDGVGDAQAVCFGIAGTAAWLALTRRGQLREGERVLVLGASGTVGTVGVQAARLLGASRVVAAARSEDGLRRAAELGADATVSLRDATGAELTRRLLDASGGEGFDLVLDPLWGEPASAAVDALAMRGRLVQLGQSAGPTASFSSVNVRFKELSILGYTNFASTPEEHAGALQALWRHAAAGELQAEVQTLPLDEIATAWERQASSPGHKLVLLP